MKHKKPQPEKSQQKRTKMFNLLLTPSEDEISLAKAEEVGLSRAEAFRRAFFRRQFPRKVTTVAVDAYRLLGEMAANLSQIGNNINQIARGINADLATGKQAQINFIALTQLTSLQSQLTEVTELLHKVRREITESDSTPFDWEEPEID